MSGVEGGKMTVYAEGVGDDVVVGVDVVASSIEGSDVDDGGKSRENGVDAILKDNGCPSKVAGDDNFEVVGNDPNDKIQQEMMPKPPPLPPRPILKQVELPLKCLVEDKDDISIKGGSLQPYVLTWVKSRLRSIGNSNRNANSKVSSLVRGSSSWRAFLPLIQFNWMDIWQCGCGWYTILNKIITVFPYWYSIDII